MYGLVRLLSVCALSMAPALIGGCGDSRGGDPARPDHNFLVVIDSALYDPLAVSLDQYAEAMRSEQFEVHVEPWVPTDVDELKELLFDYFDHYDIEGALLISVTR